MPDSLVSSNRACARPPPRTTSARARVPSGVSSGSARRALGAEGGVEREDQRLARPDDRRVAAAGQVEDPLVGQGDEVGIDGQGPRLGVDRRGEHEDAAAALRVARRPRDRPCRAGPRPRRPATGASTR